MQRLRDLPEPLEPEQAAARELLRGIEPLPVSAAQAERVLVAVRLRGAAAMTPPMSALNKGGLIGLAVGAVIALVVAVYLLRRPEPVSSPPPLPPRPVPQAPPPASLRAAEPARIAVVPVPSCGANDGCTEISRVHEESSHRKAADARC